MRQLHLLFPVIPFLIILLSFNRPIYVDHVPRVRETRETREAGEVLVAAAADLQYAMDSLVKVFSGKTKDVHIKPVYGSSGTFFQQISNDAPFDIFFSADLEYPQELD